MTIDVRQISDPDAMRGFGAGIMCKALSCDDEVMIAGVRFETEAGDTRHGRADMQCSLVESGVFGATISGESKRLGAGDSAPPNSPHGAINAAPSVLHDVLTPMRKDFV